jgi:hypothetical protein
MTNYFPIVFEKEASGAVSAYVPGLPVYASADGRPRAERAIREVLAAYLEEHPDAETPADVRVARVGPRGVDVVSVGAMLGRKTSAKKARASRANGARGGRPSAGRRTKRSA